MNRRGCIFWLSGRGRTGKSTFARVVHAYFLAHGVSAILVDMDRNNSTLASFFPDARRPSHGDDTTAGAFVENITAEVVERGGNVILDTGGGDRLMADLVEQHEMIDVFRAHQIELNIFHFAAGGLDDFESLKKMVAMGLKPDRTILVLNEGLAGARQNAKDPFETLLSGKTVATCRKEGALVIRLPSLPLATMVAADALLIGFQEAANGEVPKDEGGTPYKNASPLPLWRRMELARWLKLTTKRLDELGLSGWVA